MHYRGLLATLGIFTLALANPASATNITVALEDAHRAELDRALEKLTGGDPAGAEKIYAKVIKDYERQAKPDQIYRCAGDDEEAAKVSILAMVGTSKDVTILGPGWCEALWGEGFVLIDLNRATQSESFLARAVEMAPTRPHYINEYAEWFKSRRQWRRSFELFERAWNMVDRDTSGPNRQVAARSLRGMGFTQIELGDLDEAERLFKLSKVYEPESPHADSELQYIASLRARMRSGGPTT